MIESTVWSPFKKMAFRFWSIYAVLFIVTNQFVITFLLQPTLSAFVPWFGNKVLDLDAYAGYLTNGSGDTTYNYVLLLILLIVSFFAAAIWSWLDRNRANYQKLFEWVVVLIRYYIILQMLFYGFGKVFYLQMGPPSVERLEQPLGDFSPMGLVWTFIGYSKAFTMLTGWLEVLGGVVLLFKRTQTLGAMIVFVVMTNVMAFNYFYDVPVKILSTHLALMSLFLVLIDARRLLNLFILNRTAEPKEIRYLVTNPKWRKVVGWVKWSLVLASITLIILEGVELNHEKYNSITEEMKIVLDVTSFKKNNERKREPEISDWKTIKLYNYTTADIYNLNDKKTTYKIQLSEDLKVVTFQSSKLRDSGKMTIKSYSDNIYNIKGIFKNDTLFARLKPPGEFNLMKYEYRWVNEFPDNR